MKLKNFLYWALALDNDVNAIKNNTVGKRLAMRTYSKICGRVASKLFK